jgi:hypothetical protein
MNPYSPRRGYGLVLALASSLLLAATAPASACSNYDKYTPPTTAVPPPVQVVSYDYTPTSCYSLNYENPCVFEQYATLTQRVTLPELVRDKNLLRSFGLYVSRRPTYSVRKYLPAVEARSKSFVSKQTYNVRHTRRFC